MKNMKRAIRRHHYSRLKNKRYLGLKQWNWWSGITEEFLIERSCRMITTACGCSCTMCGNPRRHFGEITLQEQRNLLSFEEDMGI